MVCLPVSFPYIQTYIQMIKGIATVPNMQKRSISPDLSGINIDIKRAATYSASRRKTPIRATILFDVHFLFGLLFSLIIIPSFLCTLLSIASYCFLRKQKPRTLYKNARSLFKGRILSIIRIFCNIKGGVQ